MALPTYVCATVMEDVPDTAVLLASIEAIQVLMLLIMASTPDKSKLSSALFTSALAAETSEIAAFKLLISDPESVTDD